MVGTAGCAGETQSFGVTSAGPTKSATRAAEPAGRTASERPERRAQPRRTPSTLCELFPTGQVTSWLGLSVRPGRLSSRGRFQTCTWRAAESPRVPSWRVGDPVLATDDGIVTITRGPVDGYSTLAERITATARAKKASSTKDLTQFGTGAFAIGASVSGVPIWKAVAIDGSFVVAVEMSGADSRSSVARVGEFLGETLRRLPAG